MESSPSLSVILKPGPLRNSEADSLYFQVKLMVASLTVRMIMKKYMGKCKLRKTYTKYYEVISNYSYRRLVALLKVEPFKIVLEQFLKSDDFEEMLLTDESLLTDQENYRWKAQSILDVIENLPKS